MSTRAGFDELFRIATGGAAPYHWQHALAARPAPARVIVAPTGSGKTEAVVMDWLWRRRLGPAARHDETPRRLVLASPMRVLVEQTRVRVQEMLDRLGGAGHLDPVPRVHVLAGGAADDSWTLDPERDSVLVGTIDMLLSRALNRGFGKAGRARWPIDFGLLGSDCQWVLDEVQLMDAAVSTSAQLEAFRSALGTGAPARTVWMSATLNPAWLDTRDHPAPEGGEIASLGAEDEEGDLGRRLRAAKTVIRESADAVDLASLAQVVLREHVAASAASEPPLTIAIVNRVVRALGLYDAIAAARPDGADLVLLHSRFRPPDRRRLVDRLQEPVPAGGRIVVSTQVIEAGVDLDAAALVTDLAPWASLVQRAGRLNRRGLREETRLVWLDPGPTVPEKDALPYAPGDLAAARELLVGLEGRSLSPREVSEIAAGADLDVLLGRRPSRLLLRRPDLVDLFDTDPTLDGDEPDIGRYIRDGQDLDLGIAWREIGTHPPDRHQPHHDEVCPVPVSEAKTILGLDPKPWRWSYVRRVWERPDRLRPGDLLLVDVSAGGYDRDRGWTGKRGLAVEPVPNAAAATALLTAEGDADDPESTRPAGGWITLVDHTDHVVAELEAILAGLPRLAPEHIEALRTAARFHDAGKVHRTFQERLREAAGELPDGGPWAKSPVQRSSKKPATAFRHELASALLLLDRHSGSREIDLPLYLVGAHHGKLRLVPRVVEDDHRFVGPSCLGVVEGEELPAVALGADQELGPLIVDLSPLRLGSIAGATWTDRALDLLDRLGPFRLGYLEALLRSADQRASRNEEER